VFLEYKAEGRKVYEPFNPLPNAEDYKKARELVISTERSLDTPGSTQERLSDLTAAAGNIGTLGLAGLFGRALPWGTIGKAAQTGIPAVVGYRTGEAVQELEKTVKDYLKQPPPVIPPNPPANVTVNVPPTEPPKLPTTVTVDPQVTALKDEVSKLRDMITILGAAARNVPGNSTPPKVTVTIPTAKGELGGGAGPTRQKPIKVRAPGKSSKHPPLRKKKKGKKTSAPSASQVPDNAKSTRRG
jgi:hypothetical protein